jgi:excisionase family DNA binding protein
MSRSITTGQVASQLGVCRETVRRLADRGILPAEQWFEGAWRRFDPADVEKLRQKARTSAEPAAAGA